MRSLGLVVVLLGLLGAACAHRPLAVLLSFAACPVTRTPDGRDVDDGGVDLTASVATDLAPAPRRLAVAHVPGACDAAIAVQGGLPSLICTDPQVARYVLAWTRPSPRTLVLERREYASSAGDSVPSTTAPTVRQPLAELPIERATWINAAPRQTCTTAP